MCLTHENQARSVKTELTRVEKVRAYIEAESYVDALRIAAKFPRLGDQRDAIQSAWEAHLRPDFYRQLGRDPQALFATGVEALRERFGGVK